MIKYNLENCIVIYPAAYCHVMIDYLSKNDLESRNLEWIQIPIS